MRHSKAFRELSNYKGTGGTYASVKPTQETIHKLEPLRMMVAQSVGDKHLQPVMDWHVTLVYDAKAVLDPPSVHENFPLLGSDIMFEAKADGFAFFGKHLVLVLYSDSLHDLHDLIKEHLGLKHSFDEYAPHITMAELKSAPDPQQAEEILATLNGQELPDDLEFTGIRFEDVSWKG